MNTWPLDFYHQSDNPKKKVAKFAKFRLAFPPVEAQRAGTPNEI